MDAQVRFSSKARLGYDRIGRQTDMLPVQPLMGMRRDVDDDGGAGKGGASSLLVIAPRLINASIARTRLLRMHSLAAARREREREREREK